MSDTPNPEQSEESSSSPQVGAQAKPGRFTGRIRLSYGPQLKRPKEEPEQGVAGDLPASERDA